MYSVSPACSSPHSSCESPITSGGVSSSSNCIPTVAASAVPVCAEGCLWGSGLSAPASQPPPYPLEPPWSLPGFSSSPNCSPHPYDFPPVLQDALQCAWLSFQATCVASFSRFQKSLHSFIGTIPNVLWINLQ